MRYIIDRKTNEHERYGGQNYDATKYRIVEADSDGWIAHTGNECPLPDDVRCEAKVRTGKTAYSVPVKARSLYWEQCGMPGNIVAYRPILAEKAQEPYTDDGTRPEPPPADYSDDLMSRLKAAHAQAQQIPDLEAELREVLGSMGYDLVSRSPFVEPEQAVETPQQSALPDKETLREIFAKHHESAYNPKSEHYRFEHFYKDLLKHSRQDMSDWRNWREGDVLECSQPDVSFLFEGELATIEFINEYGDIFIEENSHGYRPQNFRFHSRPAKGEK